MTDIDHDEFTPYCAGSQTRHTAIAGMMYVDDDDLHTVAQQRQIDGSAPVGCEFCPMVYRVWKGWVQP